jgi:hypothetical protein
MDAFCFCGHPPGDHDFDEGMDGMCMVWIEEEDRWCPCLKFQGEMGTNAITRRGVL